MKIFAAALLLALVAACGSREPLQPAPGQDAPPQPLMTSETQTAQDLLEIPPMAKPERVDEVLRRSEERADDRFDLPPPE